MKTLGYKLQDCRYSEEKQYQPSSYFSNNSSKHWQLTRCGTY